MVDLPQPDSPTSATVAPAGMCKFSPAKTGRAPYEKCTSRNSTAPFTAETRRSVPTGRRASAPSPPRGFRSITACSLCAAMRALTMLSMDAPAAPNMNPPNKTEKKTMMTVPPETQGELPALSPESAEKPPTRYPHPQFGFASAPPPSAPAAVSSE